MDDRAQNGHSVEEVRQSLDLFLMALYDLTNGGLSQEWPHQDDASRQAAIDLRLGAMVAQRLKDDGLLSLKTFGPTLALTTLGRDRVESLRSGSAEDAMRGVTQRFRQLVDEGRACSNWDEYAGWSDGVETLLRSAGHGTDATEFASHTAQVHDYMKWRRAREIQVRLIEGWLWKLEAGGSAPSALGRETLGSQRSTLAPAGRAGRPKPGVRTWLFDTLAGRSGFIRAVAFWVILVAAICTIVWAVWTMTSSPASPAAQPHGATSAVETMAAKNASHTRKPTAEEVMRDFHAAEGRAEDMLMDPLILNADIVAPVVIEEIKNRRMDKRRYAIGFLGNERIRAALPVLRSILADDSEMYYFRADALGAIFEIDDEGGRQLAQKYAKNRELGWISTDILTGAYPYFHRTHEQARTGYHQ